MNQTYSFYRPDGTLTGRTVSCPPEMLAGMTPAGLTSIEGAHDHLCKRVDVATGEVVDYQPPQPSPHHEWDGRRWNLSSAAQQAKAAEGGALVALAAADQRRIRALSDLALGIAGATARLESIEAECAQHRARLAAARDALK